MIEHVLITDDDGLGVRKLVKREIKVIEERKYCRFVEISTEEILSFDAEIKFVNHRQQYPVKVPTSLELLQQQSRLFRTPHPAYRPQ